MFSLWSSVHEALYRLFWDGDEQLSRLIVYILKPLFCSTILLQTVVRIKGAVSANNYIDFSGLQLGGNFMCIQLCPVKSSIATLHIELATMQDVSLRITISTLYDKPRFLGRSLRLPLPFVENQGWTNVLLDFNQMLTKYCQSSSAFKCVKVCTEII